MADLNQLAAIIYWNSVHLGHAVVQRNTLASTFRQSCWRAFRPSAQRKPQLRNARAVDAEVDVAGAHEFFDLQPAPIDVAASRTYT
jgi:hypothetical protein